MLKINYSSDNSIVKSDENGTFITTKGRKTVHFAGLKVYDYYWDTEYEDLTIEDKKKPGFR